MYPGNRADYLLLKMPGTQYSKGLNESVSPYSTQSTDCCGHLPITDYKWFWRDDSLSCLPSFYSSSWVKWPFIFVLISKCALFLHNHFYFFFFRLMVRFNLTISMWLFFLINYLQIYNKTAFPRIHGCGGGGKKSIINYGKKSIINYGLFLWRSWVLCCF